MITQEQLDLEKRLSEITGKVVCYKTSLAQPKEKEYHKIDNLHIFSNIFVFSGYTKMHFKVDKKTQIVTAIVNPDEMNLKNFEKYITTHNLVCLYVKPGINIVGKLLNYKDTASCDSNYVDAIKYYLFYYGKEKERLRLSLIEIEIEESLAWSKANLSLVDFIKEFYTQTFKKNIIKLQ